MGDWNNLPDLLLGHIFSYLPTLDKLFLEDVCLHWADAALHPEVWESFTFSELDRPSLLVSTFPESNDKYSLFKKDLIKQRYVSKIKTVGKYFKVVKIYYTGKNSGQILNCLSENCFSVHSLKIQRIQGHVNVVKNHQNTCKEDIYKLIQQNAQLKHLEVANLDANNSTATQQRDVLPFGAGHSRTLQQLFFFQSFQSNNLGNLMYLVNLKELAIEPNMLSYSLLYHLSGQALTNLHIVALSKHVEFYKESMQNWQWKQVCTQNPAFRVHCHFGVGHEWTEKEIMLKKEMPVQSFKYKKDYLLHYETISPLLMNYSSTLEIFIDISFSTRVYEFAKTDENYRSINAHVLNFVRACPKLKILMIKEVLLSSTVMAMLFYNRNLQIILMKDHLRFDTENSLCQSGELSQPLSDDLMGIIQKGGNDEASVQRTIREMTGRTLNLLTVQEYFSLMLEHYGDFR